MITGHVIAALAPSAAQSIRRSLFRLGGLGLIPLGLLDNSPVPLPGIMDVATIVMSARHGQLWIYYALMATTGSLIGGFLTYWLALRGGKEALERRFPPRKVDKLCKIFERWGAGAVAIPALLPPPIPMVPFLLAAGVMQYPAKKFLAALTVGRISRYLILSYLGARYGRQIVAFIVAHGHPVAVAVIMGLIALSATVFYFWQGRKNKRLTLKLGERFF